MVKPKIVKTEDIVGCKDMRRRLRSQSTNREDGDGRYDLRPLSTKRNRRRWHLRRQDAKTFLSNAKSAVINATRRRLLVERRRSINEQPQPQEDGVATTSSLLPLLTVIAVPSIFRAIYIPLDRLHTFSGGDGDSSYSGNVSSYHIASPTIITMTRIQENLASLATNTPEEIGLQTMNRHHELNDDPLTEDCVNVPSQNPLVESDGGNDKPPEQ